MRGAICLPSPEPLSPVLGALVSPFTARGAGGALLLQDFPWIWSWHWCWIWAVLLPCPGCCDPAARAGLCLGCNIHGKQLGFHLSRFVNKFRRNSSSWQGLCHMPAGLWSLLPASPGCPGWGWDCREMLCTLAGAELGEMLCELRVLLPQRPFPVGSLLRGAVASHRMQLMPCISHSEAAPSYTEWRQQVLEDLGKKTAWEKGKELEKARRCHSSPELCGDSRECVKGG